MIAQETADAFAADWVSAWNAHDLDRIVSHYGEDVEFRSPIAERLLGAGTIRGRQELRAYFEEGLARAPQLHFELLHVLPGVDSVTLCYRGVGGVLAAEVMELDGAGRVRRAMAHYTRAARAPTLEDAS